ncbi:MAG: class I SAM-dependent methyltransferase [Chloroflexota bacterium]
MYQEFMYEEVDHPEFLALLQKDDAYLLSLGLEELNRRTATASTFAEEGLWSDELVAYIEQYPYEEYIQFHWIAERHYANKLRELDDGDELNSYYVIGYARIIALMMRYHVEMGHDSNDFYFILTLLQAHLGERNPDDVSIFEVGTGAADLFLQLSEVGYCNLEGIEISPAAARVAQERLTGHLPADSIKLMSFEHFQQQYPDKRYDIIVNSNLIEHVPPVQMEAFLSGIYAHLKPGGYMVTITPHRLSGPHDVTRYFRGGGSEPEGFHLREYTLQDLEALLTEAGFSDFMTVRSLPQLNYFWDVPSKENFVYKRNMEPMLREMSWKLRKPLLDGMYFKGLICQKPN